MSVESEVSRISAAAADIAAAVGEKGVAVPPGARLDDLPDLVRQIPTVSAEEVFLLAHPVGSLFRTTSGESPAVEHGGTWKQVPSLGASMWERTS